MVTLGRDKEGSNKEQRRDRSEVTTRKGLTGRKHHTYKCGGVGAARTVSRRVEDKAAEE